MAALALPVPLFASKVTVYAVVYLMMTTPDPPLPPAPLPPQSEPPPPPKPFTPEVTVGEGLFAPCPPPPKPPAPVHAAVPL